MLAKIFGIKPDKEVAEEARKKRLEEAAGGDDFLKVPEGADADALDISRNSDLQHGAADENEAIDKINESFEALIKEKTYPYLI